MAQHAAAMAHSDCRVCRRVDGAGTVRSAIALHQLIMHCAPVGLLLLLARLLDIGGVESDVKIVRAAGRRCQGFALDQRSGGERVDRGGPRSRPASQPGRSQKVPIAGTPQPKPDPF